MAAEAKSFLVEDARIVFRNFEGKAGQYNRKGERSFAVVLEQEVADALVADGWNVKYLRAQDEGEPETPYIQVSVNFNNRPPRVVMITSTSRTNLTEESIEVLDWAEIQHVDLIARGFDWERNGKTGTKAYLKSLFVTIEEDELERKYGVNHKEDVND